MFRATPLPFAFIMFLLVDVGCSPEEKGPAELPEVNQAQLPEPMPKRERVDAEELCRAYAENQQAADKRFRDNVIIVSGEVVGRETALNVHILYLKAGHSMTSIACEFPQSAYNGLVAVHLGKNVYVRGICSGINGTTIKMRDCVLD